MPGNRLDPVPVLPPYRDGEPTLRQHGVLPATPPEPADLGPPTPRVQLASTGARVALPAVENSALMHPAPQVDRVPAPPERRPLMPSAGVNTGSTLAGQHQTVAPPGLLRPVRAPESSSRPPVGVATEVSDLIQTFEAGPDDSHPGMPYPAVAQKTIPPGSGMTIPPPGKILRHGPPGLAKAPPLRPVQPVVAALQLPATAVKPTQTPALLPLATEHVVALVLEHRQRLKALDTWARVLEVAAVLAGVGVLLAVAAGQLPLAGGLALAAVALAAQATTLRHVAHTSAQVSALLDALSRPSR